MECAFMHTIITLNASIYASGNKKGPGRSKIHRGPCITLVSSRYYLSRWEAFPFSSIAAWAAASLATGILLGEQDT